MRHALLTTAFALVSCSFTGVRFADLPQADLQHPIAEVSAADGVSRVEAIAIANYLFERRQLACGGFDRIWETPTSWRISTVIGFAAEPGETISIGKSRGSVSVDNESCYSDLDSLLSDERTRVCGSF